MRARFAPNIDDVHPTPGAIGQDPPPTERLWLTEPTRLTALAHVTQVRGDRFTLDRSIYCPKSHHYRHVQRPDRGVVWLPNGEKRKLKGVFEHKDVLWHTLRDARPKKGDKVNCHLDAERRQQTARTHTALHLLLHAVFQRPGPALVRDPEVRGGGTARLTLDAPYIDRDTLAAWVQACRAWIHADRPLTHGHTTRDAAPHVLRAQRFQGVDAEPYPGPEGALQYVDIDGVGAFPCDGTHTARTSDVVDLTLRHAHPDGHGHFVLVLQIPGRGH